MAFTQADIDELKKAIKTGALEVQYTDRRVKYRSLDEMMRLLRTMEDEAGVSNPGKPSAGYPTFSKGF